MNRFGPLEQAVMEALWAASEPRTAREVLDALPERGLAYSTVRTVLDRLVAKQFVRRTSRGRAGLYAAAAGRDDYVADLMRQVLDLSGDRSSALVHFARSIDEPDAAALREGLERTSEPGRGEGPRHGGDATP